MKLRSHTQSRFTFWNLHQKNGLGTRPRSQPYVKVQRFATDFAQQSSNRCHTSGIFYRCHTFGIFYIFSMKITNESKKKVARSLATFPIVVMQDAADVHDQISPEPTEWKGTLSAAFTHTRTQIFKWQPDTTALAPSKTDNSEELPLTKLNPSSVLGWMLL